jgi:hypothetical protein
MLRHNTRNTWMIGSGVVLSCLLQLPVLAVNPDQFCELTDATAVSVQEYCPSEQLVLDEARGICPATPEAS